jgi:hypothetical protein
MPSITVARISSAQSLQQGRARGGRWGQGQGRGRVVRGREGRGGEAAELMKAGQLDVGMFRHREQAPAYHPLADTLTPSPMGKDALTTPTPHR